MKRKFFYFAASALVLSACTSEDVIEDVSMNRNVISFENVVNKHSRATDLTKDNLDHFSVFGYYTMPNDNKTASTIFYNEVVSTKDGTNWSYTGEKRYWIPNAKYYFFAYNCGNVEKLSSDFGSFEMNTKDEMESNERVMKILNYECDDTHQHDLIFASNTGENYGGIVGKDGDNSPVSLSFKHLLSKVRVNFKSTFPTEYTIRISNVSVRNVRNIGSYSPISEDNNGWFSTLRGIENNEHPQISLRKTTTTIVDEKPSVVPVTIETTNTGDDKNSGVTTDYAYFLPFDYTADAHDDAKKVFIYFDLVVFNKGQEVFKKDGMTGTFAPVWNPGYAYTYNVEVNGDAANLKTIEFTLSSVEDWVDYEWTDEEKEAGKDNVSTDK